MRIIIFFISLLMISCAVSKIPESNLNMEKTKSDILDLIKNSAGTYAVVYKDLQNDKIILINENENFHAASTMKTPVMIEVFKQAHEGKFSLNDSILIKNEFKSIVDNSLYSLDIKDDGDDQSYSLIGKNSTIYNLVHKMITVSSNLATNLLIEKVDAKNVTSTMRDLNANKIMVLRGVEDNKAYNAGLNNTTTAFDLMIIFEAIARYKILDENNSKSMINILLDQKFNDVIPVMLPSNLKVAHKTGSIVGIQHDSGIIFLPDGRKYILVLLSKNLPDEKTGKTTLSQISKIIYDNLYSLNYESAP